MNMTSSPGSEYSSPVIQHEPPQIIATQTAFNFVQPVGAKPFNYPTSQFQSQVPFHPQVSRSPPPEPEQPTNKNPFKKRKLEEDAPQIILSRDVLKSTTCEEFEEQVRQVTQVRELTPAEEYAVSRQRRLIKGREYANNSRVKKKQENETLREQNDRLLAEKNTTAQEMALLQQENQRLTFENAQIKLLLSNLGVPCPMFSNPASQRPMSTNPSQTKTTINLRDVPTFSPLPYTVTPRKPSSQSKIFTPQMGTTTLVLFAIMFSFAMFGLPSTFSETIPLSTQFDAHSARRLFEDPSQATVGLKTSRASQIFSIPDSLGQTNHPPLGKPCSEMATNFTLNLENSQVETFVEN